MSASYPSANDYPPGGSPAELRQTVADMMSSVGMRSNMAVDYAVLGDDAGLAYTLRCAAAEFRAALSAAGMLAELRKAKADQDRRPPVHNRHPATDNLEVRA